MLVDVVLNGVGMESAACTEDHIQRFCPGAATFSWACFERLLVLLVFRKSKIDHKCTMLSTISKSANARPTQDLRRLTEKRKKVSTARYTFGFPDARNASAPGI
jgi:hypothetical protein